MWAYIGFFVCFITLNSNILWLPNLLASLAQCMQSQLLYAYTFQGLQQKKSVSIIT